MVKYFKVCCLFVFNIKFASPQLLSALFDHFCSGTFNKNYVKLESRKIEIYISSDAALFLSS